MKHIVLILMLLLCCENAIGWNANRQKDTSPGGSQFTRDTLRKASGTKERQHSQLREFLRSKGSLTEEQDDLLFLELSTLMKHENDHGKQCSLWQNVSKNHFVKNLTSDLQYNLPKQRTNKICLVCKIDQPKQ